MSDRMEKFKCQIRPRANPDRLEARTIEARNADELVTRFQAEGYLIVSVELVRQAKEKDRAQKAAAAGGEKRRDFSGIQLFPHVSTRELISFAIQLSALLESGLPLMKSLQVVERGVKNHFFRTVLMHMSQSVSQGLSFSYAVSRFPKVFPSVWGNLIEVGEASGKLPAVLKEIAKYQEAAQRVKGKIISAFFYPAILMVLAAAAVTFLLIFIIPKFEEIFKSLNTTLPILTQWVIFVSQILRRYFPFVAGFVILSIAGAVYVRKTPPGRFFFDTLGLRIPIMGGLNLQVAIVRFTRGLTTLIRAGVPILSGLEIAIRLANNAVVERVLTEAREAVRQGQSLGSQLETKNFFPVFMTQLVSVGEESGELDRFLEMIGNYYEERIDTFLSRLSTLLEPIMLVFMGAVIGTLVVSMFLPIIEISTGGHM